MEKAQAIYDEQLKRKLDLDSDVRLSHKDREPEGGEYHSMFSGETRGSRRSGVSRSSLRLSTVSRKKEKLALAQLNLRQLKIRQQLGEQQHATREQQEKERKGVKVETTNQQFDSGGEMVKALRQVVSSPKVEYHRFDGDPLKYVTFMHNFETYLEKDNPDESRRL